MRRVIASSLAGIVLLFGGCMALIAWLTSPTATELQATFAQPVASASGAVAAAPRLGSSPEPASQSQETLPPGNAAAPPLDLRGSVPALEAGITKRCGGLQLQAAQDPTDPARGAQGRTVLLLELQPLGGQLRIADSAVQVPGNTRPALVACAQWALRGLVLPAPSDEPGGTIRVPVLLSMRNGSGGAGNR